MEIIINSQKKDEFSLVLFYATGKLTLRGIHSLTGKRNSMLFNVNVLDTNLDNVACLEHFGGVLNKLIAHLGDVKKTVVVNTDINEATEVNNVSNRTLKLHIGLKVVNIENVGGKDR